MIRSMARVPCAVPCNVSAADTVFDVHMRDGTVLQNYRSLVREIIPTFNGSAQALHLYAWRNGHCTDSIVPVAFVTSVSTGGLGSMSAPLVLPIAPAREFYRVTSNTIPVCR